MRVLTGLDLLIRLTVLFANVKPKVAKEARHPCVDLLMHYWPVLDEILTIYGHLIPVNEAFARLVRSSIDAYGLHFSPLLAPLLNKIVALFEKCGHSAYLWMARNCIKEFGYDSAPQIQDLFVFIGEMTRITYDLFQKKSVFEMPDGMLILLK